MAVVPITTNSANVLLVQTGCWKLEFDSTYPVQLNGIISQDEYRQSISKINRTMMSNKISTILVIIYVLSLIGGIILLMFGRVSAIVGMVVIIAGLMVSIIGYCIVYFQRMARIRQAIAEESMKYSSRSSVPCTWRLGTTKNYFRGYGNRHNSQSVSCISLLNLVIDIGRPTVSDNQAYYNNGSANESVAVFGQQNK